MDWDLLLRFQIAGAKIVRVPYFLACFRIHPAQKTAAPIHSVGQNETDRLHERTFGRRTSPEELESNPHLIRYPKSTFIGFLWKLGIRAVSQVKASHPLAGFIESPVPRDST